MGYARKDVEKTKKIAKKFVRYQEGGRTLQHWADKIPRAGKRGESSVQD